MNWKSSDIEKLEQAGKISVVKERPEFIIGIDTGKDTGIATWSRTAKALFNVESVKIHTALQWVKEWNELYPGKILVRVEDARLRKWIPKQKNESAERGRREGAGSVKRDASIWQDFLEEYGIAYELVAPKNNKTKMKQEEFKKITGWKESTNEHGRDAAMLVINF